MKAKIDPAIAEPFAALLDAFDRSLASQIARAEPPLDGAELSKAGEILRSTGAIRALLLGKTERAN
jgi:hypothetical protein